MNLFKFSLLCFCIIGFTNSSFAQDKTKKAHKNWYQEAVVSFHNGNILKGQLLSLTEDSVKIEILGGSLFVHPMTAVRSVEMTDKKIFIPKTYEYNRDGIYYGVFGAANMNAEDGGPGFFAVVGHQYRNYLAAGAGLGFNLVSVSSGVRTIPLFLEVRGNLLEKPISPIYSLAAGYGFALKNRDFDILKASGGLFLYPAVGLRFDSPKGSAFMLDFGYQFQKAKITSQQWNGVSIDNIQYRRFSVRLGWFL